MKFWIAKIDRIIAMLFGKLTATGLVWARIGLAFVLAAAFMSWGFGKEMHWIHGVALAVLTFVTALAPDAAHNQFEGGRRGAAIAIVAFALPLFAMEFTSHAGYAAGFRGKDITEARVQNTKFDHGQGNVTDQKGKIALLEERRKELDREMSKLVAIKVNGWSVVTKPASPEELDGQIAAKQLEVDNEAKRKFCGKECEKRTNELAHLKSLRAKAVEIAGNSRQHESAINGIANARNDAGKIEHKSSIVGHQSDFFAKTASLFTAGTLKVSENLGEGAEHSLAFGLAFAFTGGPALALFIAGLYRIRDDEAEEAANLDALRKTWTVKDGTPRKPIVIPSRSLSDLVANDFAAKYGHAA